MNATDANEHPLARVRRALTGGPTPIYITSHINIDGDGLGAMLALRELLRAQGRAAEMLLDSEIPRLYRFLAGWQDIGSTGKAAGRRGFTLVALDCADTHRMGRVEPLLADAGVSVNIDHHQSNTDWGDVVWVDGAVSSTSEMVFTLAEHCGVALAGAAAEALYTGIITDTGRFCHTNTTASCLRAAAALVERGVDAGRMGELLYKSLDHSVLQLRTLALNTLKLAFGGRVATMEIRPEMFQQTGTRPIDTQEFVDIPAGIGGVELAVLLRDVPETGHTKVSLRSTGQTDVSALAQQFGGGGHRNAAGFELAVQIDEARSRVLEAVRQMFEPTA